ncbi:MAG TPA: hypothetical protein VMZ91_00505 [Candidatus Paceibacterota bacterium]|nr:hypothetical protein [Candidatus Paceibacterota bacterium]
MNFLKIIWHKIWCSWHQYRENVKNGKYLGHGDWTVKIKCSCCGREKHIFKRSNIKRE